mgnify:CR=1 FL=1
MGRKAHCASEKRPASPEGATGSRVGREPGEVPAEDYEVVVFENRFPSLVRTPPRRAVVGGGRLLHDDEPSPAATTDQGGHHG